ncbi:MAG: hypothetical protein ABFS24_04155 [Pseudomonadota bacterium]
MSTGIACPITTVTTTAMVTAVILIVYSYILQAILHLFAVGWFIFNRNYRQRKYPTQWRYRQGKSDENQY